MDKFDAIAYLKTGNTVQQQAYSILTKHKILMGLKQFSPILAGTIPIGIDVPGSDLDILCQWQNQDTFTAQVKLLFSHHHNFTIQTVIINGHPTTIANFLVDGFEIEIFAQSKPVKQQDGYRYMIIEYNILQAKGESFRQHVINLKLQGYKTEPAFALLLDLKGDPYKGLLNYSI